MTAVRIEMSYRELVVWRNTVRVAEEARARLEVRLPYGEVHIPSRSLL